MAAATVSVAGWAAAVAVADCGGSVAMTLPQSCQDWGGPLGRTTASTAAAVAALPGCRIRHRHRCHRRRRRRCWLRPPRPTTSSSSVSCVSSRDADGFQSRTDEPLLFYADFIFLPPEWRSGSNKEERERGVNEVRKMGGSERIRYFSLLLFC